MTGDDTLVSASKIFVTTNMAAAVATCSTMILTWLRYGKPDVSMTLNGSLAGLVAITAGCDLVTPVGAAIIGLIAGVLVVFSVEFFEKVVKIDDPVGAVSVHGVCGAVGTILTGLFAEEIGLFYGGGFSFFLIQILGVVSVIVWVVVVMTIIFFVIKKTIGLRVSAEEEIAGLDIKEHGLTSAYADFAPVYINTSINSEPTEVFAKAPAKVEYPEPSEKSDAKLTKIVVIARQNKFNELKHALALIGVTGLTLSHVMGCGMQKGKTEYYRGVPVEMTVLPKVKVEIVVSKVPVMKVVDTIKEVLYTGHYGDGKIFIYDVENVIKVRTGEEGYDALQDDV